MRLFRRPHKAQDWAARLHLWSSSPQEAASAAGWTALVLSPTWIFDFERRYEKKDQGQGQINEEVKDFKKKVLVMCGMKNNIVFFFALTLS